VDRKLDRILLIAALTIGGCLGIRKAWQEIEANRHPSLATTEHFISYMSNHALADANTYDHVTLDYSVGSLKRVDQILGRAHDLYVKSPASVSVRGLSAEYGAYVGEVIRRNEPNAYWTRDSHFMGEKSYPLHWKDGESYPITWCSERITNGDEDSIWFKYSVLKNPDWKKRISAVVSKKR
jgi:hypothetical protein